MERAFAPGVNARSLFQPSAYVSASWHEEARGLVRAFSGAFLFGVPLLYTMEMWWLGEISRPGELLVLLGIALVANFGLVTAAGFKRGTSLFSHIEQTLDAVAVGAIAGTVVLLIMNQINLDQAPHTILGKIVLQVLPLSIGASLAGIVFDGDKGRESDDDEGSQMPGVWHALFNDVGATAIGAMFIAATVAPTEEVPMLAARMDYPHILALIGLTLLIGYLVVFASGFDASAKRDREHLFQHPATETALSYLVALIVSFAVLLVTKQVGADDPPAFVLTQTLVLGLPAMVGGAAGRIAV
jgi:putative integral membrane protein (TIGR02587 family)